MQQPSSTSYGTGPAQAGAQLGSSTDVCELRKLSRSGRPRPDLNVVYFQAWAAPGGHRSVPLRGCGEAAELRRREVAATNSDCQETMREGASAGQQMSGVDNIGGWSCRIHAHTIANTHMDQRANVHAAPPPALVSGHHPDCRPQEVAARQACADLHAAILPATVRGRLGAQAPAGERPRPCAGVVFVVCAALQECKQSRKRRHNDLRQLPATCSHSHPCRQAT